MSLRRLDSVDQWQSSMDIRRDPSSDQSTAPVGFRPAVSGDEAPIHEPRPLGLHLALGQGEPPTPPESEPPYTIRGGVIKFRRMYTSLTYTTLGTYGMYCTYHVPPHPVGRGGGVADVPLINTGRGPRSLVWHSTPRPPVRPTPICDNTCWPPRSGDQRVDFEVDCRSIVCIFSMDGPPGRSDGTKRPGLPPPSRPKHQQASLSMHTS
jgi:hypothetical protein